MAEPILKITIRKVKYGKKITIIEVNGEVDDIKSLARDLKRRLGAGGSVKDGIIEIQGDHRRRLKIIEEAVRRHLQKP